jgi:ubiquinone biosynthesis protein UbiJ
VGHLFLVYFGVPDGAVWGNVVAEPVCVALAGIVAFLLRHKIGHALTGWWHHHSRRHHAEQVQAQRDCHQHQLDELEARLKQHISDVMGRGD